MSVVGTEQAVGITFAVTAVVMLVVGVVIGSLATYCVMKRKTTVQQSQQQVQDGGNGRQLYEDVSLLKTTTEKFEIRENVAYGPCSCDS